MPSAHATLPGLVLAFIVLALTTGDGRSLPGLMLGISASAPDLGWRDRVDNPPHQAD
jgi:hypothetical protein